jgi:elongation factor P
MLNINELQPGVCVVLNNKPYQVVEAKHLKMGRGGGIQQVKLKGLLDGSILNQNFKGNDSIEEANLQRRQAQFLYSDNDNAYFMDQETFEQFTLSKDQIGKTLDYLPSNIITDILIYNDKPVSVNPPIKVSIKVSHADPGIKGDRSNAGTKAVTLETGATIQAPLFIKTGENIIIDTRFGTYVERDKNNS